MAKAKKIYFCMECGYELSKWMGQCPSCRAWNSIVEEPAVKTVTGARVSGQNLSVPVPKGLSDIEITSQDRLTTGIGEFDRVLGGGIVKGSLVLVGGDPGIGKSTLLLQMCLKLSGKGHQILYISGEESLQQIKMRADRLGRFGTDVSLLCETNLNIIEETLLKYKPEIVIIDSIQTMFRGRSGIGAGQRQSGERNDRGADAFGKKLRHIYFYCRSCDKRRGCCRTESA